MKFTAIQAAIRSRASQIYKVMKLTTFLLIIALVQASAKGFSQKITLHETKAPLEKVITTIKQQSGYEFLYLDQELKQEKITVQVNNASIDDALKACFTNTDVDYKIVGNNIVLKKTEPSFLDNLKNKIKTELAQITVTGKVQDETGQPMIGVTVKIKDTQQATATDKNGAFTITVPNDNTVLVFSFIGYESQEFIAKDMTTGSLVIMKATLTNLKEVSVNKGYYTEKRELSTGDVSSVSAKEIGEEPISNPLQALQGRVAGLYVQQNSGVAGGNYTVRLRGQNSIANGNDPLYIVDGVPYTSTSLVTVGNNTTTANQSSPFNYLNPADIESIDVLKDADATAIYGSRGANGVILITTKKGKAGKTSYNFNIYQGAGEVTNMMSLLNTQQYLEMRHQALKNDGVTLTPSTANVNDLLKWDTTRNTNWQKVLLGGIAHITDVQGSVSGGNENTQFLFGGGYHRESSVFPGDYADQKGSVHLNLTHSSNDQKFKIVFSANYVSDSNNLPSTDLTSLAIKLAPDAPSLYNPDGTLNWANSTWSNPLSYTLQPYLATTKNLISNGILSYNIIKGLQIRTSLGYTNMRLDESQLYPTTSQNPSSAPVATALFGNSNLSTWIIEPQAEYTKKINKSSFDILLGSTFQENAYNALQLNASGYSNDAQLANIQSATSVVVPNNTITNYKYNSVFGRFNYNYDDKYLLNLTARRDGSSRFGPGKQFGNFGAIGAGWLFSNEDFIKADNTWLSYGKLRASYGTSGNDQIGDYQFLNTYSATGYSYSGATLYPNGLTNPNYGWEVNKKLEGGLELGFLKDRILLTVSYYRNRSNDELVGYALAPTAGYTSITANLPATVQNTGMEFTLNAVNIDDKNFSWKTSFNLTIPENKLISYPNLAGSVYSNTYVIGQSLFIRKTYNYEGVNPQTGVYQFQDINGDGKISSPADRQTLKLIAQQFYGGLQNNVRYKNFQLDFLIQFVKQSGNNYLQSYTAPGFFNKNGTLGNQPTIVLSNWKNVGDNSDVEKFTQNTSSAAYVAYNNDHNYGSNIISDASFIRLKNLSLSYQLPNSLKQKFGLVNCRIYIQGQNLFTVTNYLGPDPETGFSNLPPLKILSFGLQFTL